MKKAPEPIILSLALLLLALGSATLAYMFPTNEEITGISSTQNIVEKAQSLKEDEIAANLAIWSTPVVWQEPASHNRLFDSDEYLFYPSAYPNADYIKKVTPDTRTPSGVPLWWYRKYNLDITDGNVDREDPDGDGFSNIVEFKNDPVGVRQNAADLDGSKSTNPQDAQSHPDYLARLRLKEYELRPFHIQFTGYQQLNGVYLFQLHLKDVPSYNQPPLKKSGDPLGFEGYTIGAFNEHHSKVTDPNTHIEEDVDDSTLELDKPDIDLKIIVPFRKEIDSPESTANFVMLMPNDVDKVIKISRGKVFTILPYLPDTSFLVIDANDKGAIIRDKKTNKDYNILKLDPQEWNDVPVPPVKSP